jgi:hypothetical protein
MKSFPLFFKLVAIPQQGVYAAETSILDRASGVNRSIVGRFNKRDGSPAGVDNLYLYALITACRGISRATYAALSAETPLEVCVQVEDDAFLQILENPRFAVPPTVEVFLWREFWAYSRFFKFTGVTVGRLKTIRLRKWAMTAACLPFNGKTQFDPLEQLHAPMQIAHFGHMSDTAEVVR